MKKVIATVLAVLMALSCFAIAAGAYETESTLKFNEDGTFKIVQINDVQTTSVVDARVIKFINKVLDTEQPDLVVFVGDQLSDIYFIASKTDFAKAIETMTKPCEDRGIPYMVTLGNHDHDREFTLDEAGQYELYARGDYFLCTENGPEGDYFTYSAPVYSSTGDNVALNVYMFDTNNSAGGGAGITPDAVEWYKQQSAALKEANGGEAVPSIAFQHIPMKEIYKVLKKTDDWKQDGVIYSGSDGNWYVADETKVFDGEVQEAPCPEAFTKVTGQYEAFLECGDIIGCFCGHDHMNTFAGKTEDGIVLGYNGGCGFDAYGDGDKRSVRVFNFTEDDVENYETHSIYYNELMNDTFMWDFMDVFSSSLVTPIMKVIYALFGTMIKWIKVFTQK